MRVLLVSLNQRTFPHITFPLGMFYVGEALERAGHHEIRIVDNLWDEASKLSEVISDFKPELIGLSLRNISGFTAYKPIVELCKSSAEVVIGGSGFSLVPKVVYHYFGLKHGIIGEGEVAIVQFIKDGLPQGFIQCSLIDDLDSIPLPPNLSRFSQVRLAFLDYLDKYNVTETKGSFNILSKRGCNQSCIYCNYPLKDGKKIRVHSPKLVVDKIEELKGLGIESFSFVDNVFNNPAEHAREICKEIIKRDLGIRWSGFISPQFIGEEDAKLFKESGCEGAELSVDSLDDLMLMKLRKGFDYMSVKKAVQYLKDAEVRTILFLLFGWKGESETTVTHSLQRLTEFDCEAYIKFGVQIYPGTDAQKELIADGYPTSDDYFNFNSLVIPRMEEITSYIKSNGRWKLFEENC